MMHEAEQERVERLYDELQDRLRAHDKDGSIELYYQLLGSGRPLSEIISKLAPDRTGQDDVMPRQPADDAAGPAAPDPLPADGAGVTRAGAPTPEAAADAAGAADARGWPVRRSRWLVGSFLATATLLVAITFAVSITLANDRVLDGWVGAALRRWTETFSVALPDNSRHEQRAVAPKAQAQSGVRQEAEGQPIAASVMLPHGPPPGAAASATIVASPVPPAAKSPDPAPPAAKSSPVIALSAVKPADAARPVREAPPAPVPPPSPATVPAKPALAVPPGPKSPREMAEVKRLLARGDALLGSGDMTSARLFYRRGAELGDGTAALRLGETFDPVFLAQAGFARAGGDRATALQWYRRARELGNTDANLLLKGASPADGHAQ